MTPSPETFTAPPMPLPIERFSQDTAERSRARRIVAKTLSAASEHAAESGDDTLSEAFARLLDPEPPRATAAPPGVIPDRHRLNEKVEAFMAEHPGANIDAAIRQVTGEGSTEGVDSDREAMNAAVEQHMARTGESFDAALHYVESRWSQ